MHDDLAHAASVLDIRLEALNEAKIFTEGTLADYTSYIERIIEKDKSQGILPELDKTDVVVLGSFARQEGTKYSDFDYFVLQNGAPPETTHRLWEISESGREDTPLGSPGSQGVFGGLVVAANLYESIGLEGDTNKNITHRILLLTESASVTKSDVRSQVVDKILQRYSADNLFSKNDPDAPAKVPRYLLNDLVRYWRTIAIDFGAKRWQTKKLDTHLRLAKLRISRKILFAGPLATLLMIQNLNKNGMTQKDLLHYLKDNFSKPPLAQLACHISDMTDKSKESLKQILLGYNKFIETLSKYSRKELLAAYENPKADNPKEIWNKIGSDIQEGLVSIFFDDPLFSEAVRKYGVF